MGKLDKDCVICSNPAEKWILSSDSDWDHWDCPRCGKFEIDGLVALGLETKDDPEKTAKLSGWVREENNFNAPPKLTDDTLKRALSFPLPTTMERAEKLLLEATRGQKNLGITFEFTEPRFLAASYSNTTNDVEFFIRLLERRGWIGRGSSLSVVHVSGEGYIHLDEMARKSVDSSQGFIAMWFDEDFKASCVEGFRSGIKNAGYKARLVSDVEHVGKIDDEIIAQIRQSRFVVADFTGHRGGVYFEAGFALGLDLPVIWTCRENEIDELHFDIRQYNTITWNTLDELADRLQKRIEALIGVGPNKILA